VCTTGYDAVLLATAAGAAREAPLREAAALPAVCATMHAARDAGFLVGCARLGVPDARARGSAPRWIQPPRSGASRASRLTLRR